MSVPVLQSVQNFLDKRARHHLIIDDPDFINLELQILGDPNNPDAISARIPKNAGTDPEFKSWNLQQPLDTTCLAIGSTGWDWRSLRSRWVGFDFDSITGHSAGVGISQQELNRVREEAQKLPYVTVVTSKGGVGLHLFVHLEPFEVRNHTEHTAVARAVLKKMGHDTGFDFSQHVDVCGGNMWLWHHDCHAEGHRLEKRGHEKLPEPEGWRALLTAATIPAVDDDDQFSELTEAYRRVSLDAKHHQIIGEVGKKATTVWDSDNHLLRTHTCALKQVHITHSLSGEFEDDSPGTDLKQPNCFCFPLPDGGFMVYRFGRDEEPREFNVTPKENVRVVPASAFNQLPAKDPGTADQLVEIAKKCDLFRTPGNDLHATVSIGNHKETYPLNSKDFRQYLQHEFYSCRKKTAPAKAMSEAMETIESLARFEGEVHEVHHRYVCNRDRAYLDLCNDKGEVVEIDSEGWRVGPCPDDIKFVRVRGQLPLPHPEPGTIDELREYISVADERSWHLLVAGLLCCLQPVAPYWVTILQSDHGSGKTTTLRLIRRIIDPNEADVRTTPKKEDGLLLAAKFGLLVAIDNASTLPDWLADALCRLATGSGLSDRAFYSQKDEFVMSAQRPTYITTIVDLTGREDLLSRCLWVRCGAITSENRLAESDLFASYYEARPRILGALLTAVSAGLKNLPDTKPEKLPRMADAYRWTLACEPGLGWEPGTFAKYFNESEEAINETIMSHPVAIALQAMLKDVRQWVGNSSALSKELLQYADSSMVTDELWPKSSAAMGKTIQRLTGNLREVGITVDQGRRRCWSFSLN